MTTNDPIGDDAYLALIEKRTSKEQRTVKRIVSLDPSLYDELEAAREALRLARGANPGEDDKPTRMNGGPVARARKALEAVEQKVRDTSIVVSLRPQDGSAHAAMLGSWRDANPEGRVIDQWKFIIGECFVSAARVGSPDVYSGAPIPAITAEHFRKVVDGMPFGEVQAICTEIEKLQQAPDFPLPAAQ